jgi:hypothetical protein
MDAIDKLLVNHSKMIEIHTFPNPQFFEVIFGAFPAQGTLCPLFRLFESKRFGWDNNYDEPSDPLKTLLFRVKAVNVIPSSEAIASLAEVWTDMGYKVTLKHEGGNDKPRQGIGLPRHQNT